MVERRSTRTPTRLRRRLGPHQLVQAMHDLYGSDIARDELREDSAAARPRDARRGVRRGRAGGVREKERQLGAELHARARALRDPPGRRHPLARAPREHGLPARGRPPARDGAEGSARRVHVARATRCSRSSHGIREEVVFTSLPRRARARGRRRARAKSTTAPRSSGSSSRTPSTIARRRGRDLGRRSARDGRHIGGTAGSVAAPAAARRRRGGEDRPQRPCWCGSGKKYKKCHGA